MKAVLRFIKKEPIMIMAIILAVVTSFFVPPSLKYVKYIDFKTLTTLFSFMIVIKGLSKINIFKIIATKILPYIKNSRGLVTTLVFIPTILSVFIINDVVVLTFVPFALILLNMCDKTHLSMKTVILICIGSNLGGLISPLGNSQNLYLFSYYDLSPTYLLQRAYITYIFAMLLMFVCCMYTKKEPVTTFDNKKREIKKGKFFIYMSLLILAVSVVVLKIPNYYLIAFGVVVAVVFLVDKSLFKSVNYFILITFVAFFIFSGNIKNIESISIMMSKIIIGNEYLLSIGLTQIISNTPTAIIVSQFSNNIFPVVMGINIAKNGTIIASMAGIVVMRFYTANDDRPLKFLGVFTMYGLFFLILMTGVGYLNMLLLT